MRGIGSYFKQRRHLVSSPKSCHAIMPRLRQAKSLILKLKFSSLFLLGMAAEDRNRLFAEVWPCPPFILIHVLPLFQGLKAQSQRFAPSPVSMRVTKSMDKNRMALLQAFSDPRMRCVSGEAFYEERLNHPGFMQERFASLAISQCVSKDKLKRRMDQAKAD